jgi:hypothetical protein
MFNFLVFGVFVCVGTRNMMWCCEWCLCLIVYGHESCWLSNKDACPRFPKWYTSPALECIQQTLLGNVSMVDDLLDNNSCFVLLQGFDDVFAMVLVFFARGNKVSISAKRYTCINILFCTKWENVIIWRSKSFKLIIQYFSFVSMNGINDN